MLIGPTAVAVLSGGAGEDKHVRSRDSTAGNGFCAAGGDEERRLSVSGSADTDFDLWSRGEVRRLCDVVSAVLEVLRRVGFDEVESADIEELDDMEVRGGRLLVPAAGLLEAVQRSDCGFAGDESVKSSSSSSLCVRSSGDAGIGVVSNGGSPRVFVGVADALQVSSVVCLVLFGELVTETPRGTLAVLVVLGGAFALLAAICEADGRVGELSRSNMSIASVEGGDFDRPDVMLVFAGSV